MADLRDFRRRAPAPPRLRASKPKRHRADRGRRARRILFPLLALAIMVLCGAWGFRLFQRWPTFRLETVRVEGCGQVSPQEILDRLELQASPNILLLDLSELSGRVRSNPWIQEASIRRCLPHTLVVRIEERRPAGILPGDDRLLVSEDGVILASLKGADLPRLPLIRLSQVGDLEVGKQIESGLFQGGPYLWRDFHRILEARGGQIREIRQARDGSLSMDLGEGMPSLRWRPESLEEQAARLKGVMAIYDPDWRTLEYIDLRIPGKVILKPAGKGGGGFGKG